MPVELTVKQSSAKRLHGNTVESLCLLQTAWGDGLWILKSEGCVKKVGFG